MSAQSRKLNDLLSAKMFQVLPGTFPALAAYAAKAEGAEEAFFGTLAGALTSGFEGEFISPILPRGLRLNTSEEVLEADLDYNVVEVKKLNSEEVSPDIIISGHAGTVEILQSRYPEAKVVSGNVTPEEVKGKVIVGTLPPHLAAEAKGYIPVRIENFDYSRDGDLAGDELLSRLVVDSPVKVTVS